ITNIATQEFSGDFSINGNLNLNISSNIPAGISKVFANNLYSMFQTGENIQIISGAIDFDTGAIDLELVRSGQVLDTFYAHQTQVQYYDDAQTSFEKIGSDSSRTTTVVGLSRDRYYNINRGIAANPTTYFTTGENLIDVTQAREEEIYNDPLPIDCDDFRETSTANISEVYYGNDLYQPYVEIITQDNVYDYYPYIMLEGSALSGAVAFDASEMEINKRFLISSTDQRYNEGRDSLYDTNFSLNSSGRIVLYGRDDWSMEWIILDIVYLNNGQEDISLYAGGQTNECADVFDYQDKFSPSLSIGQSQFIDITPDPVIQYISVGGGGGCSSNSSPQFNSDSDLTSEIQISVIKHFGNLQILKLKNKTNSDIDLRDYSLQSLDGSTQTVKGNTLFASTTMSFLGNYGFPTSQDYCVNLINDETGDVVDRYCRNSMSKASEKDQQNILDQLSFRVDEEEITVLEDPILPQNPMQTNTIKITDIGYNPDGSDKDNETITLLLLSGTQVDLSTYKIQYIKDGKSKNKLIEGILSKGNEQVFKGNYTFPNSTNDKNPVTVNLIDSNNYIVDTYIYNPNKIKEIPDGDYEVVSVIDGDTVKISYAQKEFNIRLAGIDAPESSTLRCGKVECYGPEAKDYLQSLLSGKTVSFEQSSTDDFDRFVGYIFLNGKNINQKMIHEGYAREYSYKNQDYKYNSEFKSAQNYAQSKNLGLRGDSCNGQRLCPVDETQINKDYLFNIDNILYNPEGNDSGNEEITISMQKGFTVDFADGFYLMINDTKRYLRDYGIISPGDIRTLKGTFSFPNTKKTSVSLSNGEITFDTYVYDPKLDELLDKEETLTSGDQNADISQLGIDISIVSILPNPLGKDTLGEEVGLLYSFDKNAIKEYQQTVIESDHTKSFRMEQSGMNNLAYNPSINRLDSSTSLHSVSEGREGLEGQVLNLSSGYYLKIGDRKKYLKGQLVSNQETLITGNFGIPNKAGCVEIGYENHIFDKFCYSEPEEGEKFQISNGVLESVSTIDFGILNKAKLENIGNQVCLTYGSQKFYCKNMPYSKLSTKKVNQNKLYKEFFDSFENYLKDQRKIMYYDTDIKNYFNLLNEIEKAISDGKSTFELDGKIFQTSDFQEMYQAKHPQNPTLFFKESLSEFIPSPIKQKYEQLKNEYIDYLMQK
ncbi:MAG TPA: thermonuclease family protein, partial [Candidatus Absconditabacterales bacterium]|nr:thermonuclease family protein [Candidatus Absconditabacterales bacterium]